MLIVYIHSAWCLKVSTLLIVYIHTEFCRRNGLRILRGKKRERSWNFVKTGDYWIQKFSGILVFVSCLKMTGTEVCSTMHVCGTDCCVMSRLYRLVSK